TKREKRREKNEERKTKREKRREKNEERKTKREKRREKNEERKTKREKGGTGFPSSLFALRSSFFVLPSSFLVWVCNSRYDASTSLNFCKALLSGCLG
ncbi:MAG: hypothetical protein SNJ50_19355, partial [Cyanobacteriota bacterium]